MNINTLINRIKFIEEVIMKDAIHHKKKLINKVLHSPIEDVGSEVSNDIFRKESPLHQKKKQAKAELKWERDHRNPIHKTEAERNKIHKKSGPVRDMKHEGHIPDAHMERSHKSY